jgi:hypothetical protein
MSHTIPYPPRLRLARPGGPLSAEPVPGPNARALASCPGLGEPGFAGGGQLAAGRPGHAGAR